jgi:hypothetical protein
MTPVILYGYDGHKKLSQDEDLTQGRTTFGKMPAEEVQKNFAAGTLHVRYHTGTY